MKKVLLDTDIGSDIDDALCLAYLLAQRECDLLGITTVSGEADKRAMLASVLCRVAGKPETPIFPGTENPLIVPQKQTRAQQAAALPQWDYEDDFIRGEAIEFLRETIRMHPPGEITLLAIGPLTNIALLFKMDEELPLLLKEIVLMCGVFGRAELEWNAMLDPHATAIVYNAPVSIHRSIGLDVTQQVQMNRSEAHARFNSELLKPVLSFAEEWFKASDVITFHDPLAATTLFNDSICRFERGQVNVELQNQKLFGQTAWSANGDGRHEVALGVHAQAFFDHFFAVVK